MILFPTRVTLTLLEQKLKKTDTRMSRIREIGLVTSRLSQNRSPKKKGMVSQIESKFITSETGPKAQPSFTEYPTHCFFFIFGLYVNLQVYA